MKDLIWPLAICVSVVLTIAILSYHIAESNRKVHDRKMACIEARGHWDFDSCLFLEGSNDKFRKE